MRDTVMRDIDTAFLAVGGTEFNKARCQCDHDVGHFPCEYCAIRDALCVCRREIARLRAEVERQRADRETAVVQTESDYQHEIDQLRAEVKRLQDVVRQLTSSLLSRPVGSEQERLPPQQTLTDAERKALVTAREWCLASAGKDTGEEVRREINNLLARHGGGDD